MKKAIAYVVLSLLMMPGCGKSPTAPTIINNNTNTNTNNNGPGGLSDPNAVATQCLPSEETPIRVDLNVPLTVVVGNVGAGIDATPKSANGKRSDGCNVLQGISWVALPSATCNVPKTNEFNTQMFCTAVGTCQMTATVPNKGAFGSQTVSCVAG